MDRNYTIRTLINRPVDEVFSAIVNPDILREFFCNESSGALERGQRIVWSWNEWGDFPVEVKEVVSGQRIVLELKPADWKKTSADSDAVAVILEFEPQDGKTLLKISEAGWKTDADGLKGSHENCGGWQHMALCLKAYLEHGIDLRL